MFVIGMELDIKVLKNKASEAVVISHASIIPFALGIGLSYFVFNRFAPGGFSFFLLVLWDAMSITAFRFWHVSFRKGKFIKRSLAL
jgi:Kef-type K+ transport system membrane component KefB